MTTRHGSQQLNVDGHRFNKHIVRDHITYWRCSEYGLLKCRARVKTINDNFFGSSGVHNHELISAPRKYGVAKKIRAEREQLKLQMYEAMGITVHDFRQETIQ